MERLPVIGSRSFIPTGHKKGGIVKTNDTPNKTESKSLSLSALTNIPLRYPI